MVHLVLTAVLLLTNAWALPAELQTARQFFLDGQRAEALSLLSKAIDDADLSEQDKKLIHQEADRMATRFVSDRGQQEFELAQALRFSLSGNALDIYERSLRLEPANVAILAAMTVLNLSRGDCSAARSRLAKTKEIWPHYQPLRYLSLQADICEKVPVSLDEVRRTVWPKEIEVFGRLIEARTLIDQGRGAEATILLRKLKELHPSYPETYYFAYRAGEVETGGDPEDLRKYTALCKSFGEKERRAFGFEPYLCKNSEAAEELLRRQEQPK